MNKLVPILIIMFLFLVGCEKKTHTVQYEVGGTADSMSIRYRNESRATESIDVSGTWTKSFTAESYYPLSLNVQNRGGSGTVTCRILVDGVLLSEGQSEGERKGVRCSGMPVPPTPTPGGE